MQFEAGETIEADEVAVADALTDLLIAVDDIADEHGEGVTLLAVISLYRIYQATFGFIEEPTDKNKLN